MGDETPGYIFSFTGSEETSGEDNLSWEGPFSGSAEVDEKEVTLSITPAVAEEVTEAGPASFEFNRSVPVDTITIVIEESK